MSEPAGGSAPDRLRAAAFGPSPGTCGPAPSGPWERWLAAVALGGRGHYAAAAAILGRLVLASHDPVLRAHAAITLASHRRQLGGHAAARRLDGLALRLVGPVRAPREASADPDGTGAAAARTDALVGLAADAVGLGLAGLAARLLDAAGAEQHPSWRPAVRAGWVRAELALLCGRPAEALDPAIRALHGATAGGSVRHVLKSTLVVAVVRAVLDPGAVTVAALDAVADDAREYGQLPLEWPARLAAADAVERSSPAPEGPRPRDQGEPSGATRPRPDAPNGTTDGAARRRHAAIATLSVIRDRSDPHGRRLMGESVWVPGWHSVV